MGSAGSRAAAAAMPKPQPRAAKRGVERGQVLTGGPARREEASSVATDEGTKQFASSLSGIAGVIASRPWEEATSRPHSDRINTRAQPVRRVTEVDDSEPTGRLSALTEPQLLEMFNILAEKGASEEVIQQLAKQTALEPSKIMALVTSVSPWVAVQDKLGSKRAVAVVHAAQPDENK